PIDGNRVEQLRARSTRYQRKSLGLRETAVPSQVIPFPYGPHRRRDGPSNIRRPPQVYIPGSSVRLGQVREARREDETRRIREIHTQVRSRSERNRRGFISRGGGSLGPLYQTSPPSTIHSASSQLCQPPNSPWSNSSNISPSPPTSSEGTQCSSQPSYLAEHSCCQPSSTSSIGAQHHFIPPDRIPESTRTSDEFTSQVSAEPVMSSEFSCYSLEELESKLETITEDESHESTRSSLWSTEPFNHEQKCPSIEMEHPGSLVNFCSSTTSSSAGSDTVHATSEQEPSSFTASHTPPQAEAEEVAAALSPQPCAVKRPQSPRPPDQSPGGHRRIHAPTPAIITITTQTFERPASSAGYSHSSTATTHASPSSPSTPSFKPPNESSVVSATPCVNPDAVAPPEAFAPTVLSPIHTKIIPSTSDQLSLPVEQEEKPGEQEEPEHKPQKSEDVRSNISSSLSFPIHHDGCSICTFVPYGASNANSVVSPRAGSSSRSTPFPAYQSISPRGAMLMRPSAVSPSSRNILSRVGEPIVDLQRELREAQLRQELERLGGIPNRVARPATSLQATVESIAGDSDDTGGVDV
ncbi:hypothetical protein B9Z19DRAFT_961610, partial [Tuber borchii]